MNELYYSTMAGKHLISCLEDCKGIFDTGAVAFLYSPSACEMARVRADGTFEFSSDMAKINAGNIESVYEARIFNEKAELRWLNQSYKSIKAVVLTEEKNLPEEWDKNNEPKTAIDTIEQQYLLWGKGVDTQGRVNGGWGRLAEARVGKIDVPIPLAKDEHVILKTREYLSEYGDHGNVIVFEERLLNLEVHNGKG